MLNDKVVCVSPLVVTYPKGLLNRIEYTKEKMYRLAPLGKGNYGAKIVSKQAMDEISGPRDVWGADTDVDLRLEQKGYKCIFVSSVKVFHLQKMTLKYIITRQLRNGRARRIIKYGFLRTLAHAIFRLRPLVLVGWLIGAKLDQ
jgi:GT2 family glycosyltransferase